MKHILLGAAALAAVATAAYAGRPAAPVIQARQANYKQMAAAMKGINDQLRGGSPDLAAIRPRAALLANYGVQVLRWFPHGSGPEAGVTTRARPEIWSDWPGFERAGARLLVAARAVNRAARAGDVAALRAAMPALRQACSACHDDYRAPEH
ncbi:MAG TPA: cytochrome c [Allosphingosinicella sp.]|nr:cytochrome c [Allosphingosinicella sp.]